VSTPSQHTLNHLDCPACALQAGPHSMLKPDSPFSTAAQIWLQDHSPYIKPGTLRVYKQYAKTLTQFLGDIPLQAIHIGNVRAYQRERQARACGQRINAEVIAVLCPVLKEVGLWHRMSDVYRPLPVPKKKVRQNMSEEEERRFLAVALDSSKPKRLMAGHCLVIMANTGMGFGELRHLKREDVTLDVDKPFVTVNPEGAKNDFRVRTIPLNWLALRSMRWILLRWKNLGGREPTQYILPHHGKRTAHEKADPSHRTSCADFAHPITGIYRAGNEILKEAGLEHLKLYDMRSHFATKLLSDPNVSDQMFKELFGHTTQDMRNRYSAQRIEKKSAAVERLALDPAPAVKLIAFPGGKK
jgi:integrase